MINEKFETMVVVKLMGGLGNQMFQYAFGRSLSEKLRGTLLLDVRWFEKDPLRKYALEDFNLSVELANQKQLQAFAPISFIGMDLSRFFSFKERKTCTYYSEVGFGFDHVVFSLSKPVYLDGYWQSPKYFENLAPKIVDDFSLKKPLVENNRRFAQRICNSEAVSLHVRRGDYVLNPTANKWHGVCGRDYYLKAIAKIEALVETPSFFVFSDDPVWAKENLQIKHPSFFIDHNGSNSPHEDMRLISLCKHHIIANSTFSWWGAWLSKFKDKIVIAPQKWFNDSSINTEDLIPKEWLQL